jgi:trigger factor
VEQALERLRQRAARYEPVEARPVESGDTAVVDLVRESSAEAPDTHEDVSVEIGAASNPPGFDDQVVGMTVGEEKRFPVDYPADYSITELAGTTVHYGVTVKGIKKRVVPALDEFAGPRRVRGSRSTPDPGARTSAEAERNSSGSCGTTCSGSWPRGRSTFPTRSLTARSAADRGAVKLMDRAWTAPGSIDWQAFRDNQREPARENVASALVLDN